MGCIVSKPPFLAPLAPDPCVLSRISRLACLQLPEILLRRPRHRRIHMERARPTSARRTDARAAGRAVSAAFDERADEIGRGREWHE